MSSRTTTAPSARLREHGVEMPRGRALGVLGVEHRVVDRAGALEHAGEGLVDVAEAELDPVVDAKLGEAALADPCGSWKSIVTIDPLPFSSSARLIGGREAEARAELEA